MVVDASDSPITDASSLSDRVNLPEARLSPIIHIVACGWLIIPAFQYFCTMQRTSLMLTGATTFPGLATVDLTLLYVVLLTVTIIVFVLQKFTPAEKA
ncbi:MAG: hypothetical protein ABJA67_07265 [Chthonomonadales bacterium]